MSVTTKLGDEFLRIPKLDVSGTNWVIYKDRFTWALAARSILDHVDGTGSEPADPISKEDRAKATLTEENKKLDTEWKKEVKEWNQSEAIAKQQIASSIPDSLFMKVRGKGLRTKSGLNSESILRRRLEWSQLICVGDSKKRGAPRRVTSSNTSPPCVRCERT